MTTMYDEVGPAAVVMVASLTEQQHRPPADDPSHTPRTCQQCTPTGCPQLGWALGVLAEYRARREAARAAWAAR